MHKSIFKGQRGGSTPEPPLVSLLETMRGLNLFSEKSIGNYLGISLRNKLAAAFAPADVVVVKPPAAPRRKRPSDQPTPRMAAA
jgi:hypothetical protein